MPEDPIYRQGAHDIATKSLDNLDAQLTKHNRLPLLGESRAIVFGLLKHSALIAFKASAIWVSQGIDISTAAGLEMGTWSIEEPPVKPQDPPSPV